MADRIDVTNELNQIATAIYGREVRGSIHDGIEKVANGMNEVGNEWDQKVADGDFNATIEVGTVTTGAPGTGVSVVNSGTNAEAVLDFTIPRGDAGSIENATAIDITTSDGSNVQDKLNNSFSLGYAPDGTPFEQESSVGFIRLTDKNLDDYKYTGVYYCETCTNRPVETNGWLQIFGGGSNVKQIYHLLGNTGYQTSFARSLVSGTWSQWKMTAGAYTIFSADSGLAAGDTATSPADMTMFGSFRVVLSDYTTTFLYGISTGANVRASCTDIPNATGTNQWGAVITFSSATSLFTVVRAYVAVQTATALNITAKRVIRIVGLP